MRSNALSASARDGCPPSASLRSMPSRRLVIAASASASMLAARAWRFAASREVSFSRSSARSIHCATARGAAAAFFAAGLRAPCAVPRVAPLRLATGFLRSPGDTDAAAAAPLLVSSARFAAIQSSTDMPASRAALTAEAPRAPRSTGIGRAFGFAELMAVPDAACEDRLPWWRTSLSEKSVKAFPTPKSSA